MQFTPTSSSLLAPLWAVTQWFNTPSPLSLHTLRGRVIVLHAFQMLCPGCVQHALPQAQRVADAFSGSDVAVVGLHTVFEHHDAMPPRALQAFLHEYRLSFPVGVDAPGLAGPLPQTMAAYAMRGTPTLLLIDRAGRIRRHAFGAVPDLELGAQIAQLLGEPADGIDQDAGSAAIVRGYESNAENGCANDRCLTGDT